MVFLLNGFLFLMGGITLLEEAKVVLALIQLIAAITNLAMLPRFIPEVRKLYLSIIVLIIDAVHLIEDIRSAKDRENYPRN